MLSFFCCILGRPSFIYLDMIETPTWMWSIHMCSPDIFYSLYRQEKWWYTLDKNEIWMWYFQFMPNSSWTGQKMKTRLFGCENASFHFMRSLLYLIFPLGFTFSGLNNQFVVIIDSFFFCFLVKAMDLSHISAYIVVFEYDFNRWQAFRQSYRSKLLLKLFFKTS